MIWGPTWEDVPVAARDTVLRGSLLSLRQRCAAHQRTCRNARAERDGSSRWAHWCETGVISSRFSFSSFMRAPTHHRAFHAPVS
jgi:hypothetical protein